MGRNAELNCWFIVSEPWLAYSLHVIDIVCIVCVKCIPMLTLWILFVLQAATRSQLCSAMPRQLCCAWGAPRCCASPQEARQDSQRVGYHVFIKYLRVLLIFLPKNARGALYRWSTSCNCITLGCCAIILWPLTAWMVPKWENPPLQYRYRRNILCMVDVPSVMKPVWVWWMPWWFNYGT